MEWRVSLAGDESDLNQLSESFRGPDLAVVREEEGFVLTSARFVQLTSSRAVRQEAESLISLLNGAARLLSGIQGSQGGVALGGISSVGDDGIRHIYLSGSAHATSSATARLTVTRADGTVVESNPADPAVGWVNAGLRSEAVAKVLRLLARASADWVSLYKILEIVEEDMGGTKALAQHGWASQRNRDRLARTANSERHANGKFQPPAHPMSLTDARSFIETVVRHWLAVKREPSD